MPTKTTKVVEKAAPAPKPTPKVTQTPEEVELARYEALLVELNTLGIRRISELENRIATLKLSI